MEGSSYPGDLEQRWYTQFVQLNFTSSGSAQNIVPRTGIIAVVTSITLTNISGASGDTAQVYNPDSSVVIFQALRGISADTSFVWSGLYIAYSYAHNVAFAASSGSVWSVMMAGFYQPDFYASVT